MSRRKSGRPNIKSFLQAYGKLLWKVLGAIGAVVALLIPPFYDWYNAAWKLWTSEDATLAAWMGTVFFIGLLTALMAPLYGVLRMFRDNPRFSSLGLHLTVHRASVRLQNHISQSIHGAKPQGRGKPLTRWRELAASLVDAYSEEYTALREGGFEQRHLLSSNFQIYARCVTALLETTDELPGGGYPRVWTLLRRPLTDWYNMFPLVIESNEGRGQGMITLGWWEEYKETVRQHKAHKTAKLKMHRLIACPPHTSEGKRLDENTLLAYCVYHATKALSVEEAQEVAKKDVAISLLETIQRVINADESTIPSDSLIHLIGTSNGAGMGMPTGWKPLVNHFQKEFHTGSGSHTHANAKDAGGVYYKYLREVPRELLPYDDVFLMEFPDGQGAFGIVLSVNEVLDVSGIRVLKPDELPDLLEAFQAAWQGGSTKLCFCQEKNSGS